MFPPVVAPFQKYIGDAGARGGGGTRDAKMLSRLLDCSIQVICYLLHTTVC